MQEDIKKKDVSELEKKLEETLKEKIVYIFGFIAFLSLIFAITYIFTFGCLFLIFWLIGAILSNYFVIILLLVAIPLSFVFSLAFLFGIFYLMDNYETVLKR